MFVTSLSPRPPTERDAESKVLRCWGCLTSNFQINVTTIFVREVKHWHKEREYRQDKYVDGVLCDTYHYIF